MSEYQYYEFQTVDRILSEKEMRELRRVSTRGVITPRSFCNEYSFGDFKGDPDAWMEKYFDGFLYLANWGTHQFQFALPEELLSLKTAKLYCDGHDASVRRRVGKLIFTFFSDEEGGGEWVEGEGMLSTLLALRTDVARGDLRTLYLGWLLNVQTGEVPGEDAEPPVPPNLGELSGPLEAFVEFLRIDEDLLAVAAEASPRQRNQIVSSKNLAAWISQLPTKEKDDLLVKVLGGKEAVVAAELRSRYTRSHTISAPETKSPPRTVEQLLTAAKTHRK